eukprot:367516-Pelagomonas_calceolata.AAC.4
MSSCHGLITYLKVNLLSACIHQALECNPSAGRGLENPEKNRLLQAEARGQWPKKVAAEAAARHMRGSACRGALKGLLHGELRGPNSNSHEEQKQLRLRRES